LHKLQRPKCRIRSIIGVLEAGFRPVGGLEIANWVSNGFHKTLVVVHEQRRAGKPKDRNGNALARFQTPPPLDRIGRCKSIVRALQSILLYKSASYRAVSFRNCNGTCIIVWETQLDPAPAPVQHTLRWEASVDCWDWIAQYSRSLVHSS
jgi:hypothetical protein